MRTITASEIKPGMEIEYEHGDWTFRVVVGRCEESHGEVWVFSVAGVGRFLENGQKVTVLSEPQPDEPTAFGACVEVAGERFVCTRPKHAYAWKQLGMGDSNSYSWYGVTEHGHVTVINPDPFANTEQREPRVWDRWADVPDMVAVRTKSGVVVARRDGDCVYRLFSDGDWARSILTARDLNFLAPFTEVI